MNEEDNIVTGVGGLDEDKLMVELAKLLQAQAMVSPGKPKKPEDICSSASILLSIREKANLSESEKLMLAFFYGKHIGAMSTLSTQGFLEAREYLAAMAAITVAPIEDYEKGIAALRKEKL